MSIKHPIISVTGSSGAGTSTVKHTFQQIFRRESVDAATMEGDAFHRYSRKEMKKEVEKGVLRVMQLFLIFHSMQIYCLSWKSVLETIVKKGDAVTDTMFTMPRRNSFMA